VETVLLAHLARGAASRGCQHLSGRFFPTKKNDPARDFYGQHGFKLVEENRDGLAWTLDLHHHTIAAPEWIRLKTTEGEHK
jgi:predicted enzyme involved in methoxymalonyl-ACP biosynthesis